jgi:hypothetical protein
MEPTLRTPARSHVFASSAESSPVTVMVPSNLQQPWGRSGAGIGSAHKKSSSSSAAKKGLFAGKAPLPSSVVGGYRDNSNPAIIAELRNANVVLGTELHRSHILKEKEKVSAAKR